MDGFANVMQIGDVCKHLSIAWPGMVSITLPLYCRQINDARSISITQSILTHVPWGQYELELALCSSIN